MYKSFVHFFSAIKAYSPACTEYSSAADCWQVYQNAANVKLDMLVMGRLNMLGAQEVANFGATDTDSDGSVLRSDAWTLVLNDSWILGGIHGHQDFHLAAGHINDDMTRNPNYQTSEDQTRKLTVTGRELIGVKTAGYKVAHQSELMGTVFTCTDFGLADSASFASYRRAVQHATA